MPKLVASSIVLFVLALSARASAQEGAPFDRTRRVHVMPAGYVPPMLGEDGIARLEAGLQKLRRPFHVLLAETLPGFGDEDVRAQALTDETAAAWAPRGFDLASDNLFALSFSPRKFSLLVGSRWGVELGMKDAALDRYLDAFLARVRDTPPDPIGGMLAMAERLDEDVFDATDPERIAARERAAAQAALDASRRELKRALLDAQNLLDDPYAPDDTAAYRTRLAQAKTLLEGDDTSAVRAEAAALARDFVPLARATGAAQSAAKQRRVMIVIVVVVAALVLAGALVTFFVRRMLLRRRRAALAALVDAWSDKIKNASGRYVEFYGKRDAILGLLELEGKTKVLLDEVTHEVDAIYASVAAMDAHIKAQNDAAAGARWFRFKPIDDALRAIEAPFDFDTGVLDEADLFGPPTKQLRIEPQKLEAELEARFAHSLVGWKRLETAADMRFKDAVELVPHTLLDALLARAGEHRIPARWLDDHPLFGDAESDQTVWAAADAWRWKDAIAFLDAIEALRARHDAAAARLERIIVVRNAVAGVKLAELPTIAAPGATIYDAADDPADTIEDARSAEAELEQRVLAGRDVDAVEAAGAKTVELYAKTSAQLAAIDEALRRAGPELDAAARLSQLASARLGDAAQGAQAMAQVHTNSRAFSFVGVARRRVEQGATELRDAAARLGERRHLDALRLSQRAKTSFDAARAEAEAGLAHIDQLEQVRHRYEERLAGLPRERDAKVVEIQRYGGSPSTLGEWLPAIITGPTDYNERLRALDDVVERWSAEVRRVRLAWEEAERRRREAEEAERRRRLAAQAAARSSSTSWSSGRSSFSSFSSSRSSSSSSRSGSWSSGGGSRSRSGSW